MEDREQLWIRLAENYFKERRFDSKKIFRESFRENLDENDEKILNQIVKDLHRTGSQWWSSEENDRHDLKRILLAFSRFHKSIGYCQGLHVLASLIFKVVRKNHHKTLMILIFLVDHCLPDYFSNDLNGLTVDLIVFNQSLEIFDFTLFQHLKFLRENASRDEPPLINVFTIQWFLTVFANSLSPEATLRVWDALFIDGNEILFRTALILCSKISRITELARDGIVIVLYYLRFVYLDQRCSTVSILKLSTADEFYSAMTKILGQLSDESFFTADDLIKEIYAFSAFPRGTLTEMRRKLSKMNKATMKNEASLKSSCFSVLPSPRTISIGQNRQTSEKFKQKKDQIQIQPCKISAAPWKTIRHNSNETLVNHLLIGSTKNISSSTETVDPSIDRFIRKSSGQTTNYSSFNPFPSRSFNENVANNGHKLGLYPRTLTSR